MGFNVMYCSIKIKLTGVWGGEACPTDSPSRELSKSPFFPYLFHLEASSGCDSAGFLLGKVWHVKILVASENVRIPKHSYLQAFVVKHAVYIM